MKTIFEAIGEKITLFIEKHHITQQEFADRIGVSKQVMSKIVKGQKATNIQEIQKIADVMNISVDELINHESQTNVIEDPILFMMDRTGNSKIRQHLQFLDFVMDEIIELEELSQESRRIIHE
ncbi:helix-turn-helix transcriptional regulator [Schinkia azotoformans]|uniref:Helix-turn-helix domain-containing protein n=1 Tax=Schinkia azotoformans LMG 9581 TaxID=1131731 RepID=K6DIS5_SCHAZ|nr:helix-turn-helix transcriptional regulator [Schinkia azotoformans]EKN67978.1 helix-turn-helix domain-containing protein [Schinkia azotoformans LMG 9581]MEC1637002.1 helix-turn-helix transcriptional regulator [Schinkia azotoformans]MEC1722178.1 helix-turn-helix transcriptional regulator [Schinkia azotoformans]MEC1947032.1 helix-turn-helix transcriptional regulator [Schinkia azotoformans]MED4412460.1 helix-turn-helix transcriptional regulator [Schinkia azotoformans]